MSEPQSQEVWQEKPKAGFGVEMSEQQFEKMMGHLNHLTSETERREAAVANSLNELKQIEAVRTYASVVKDITTSIQTLSQIQGTDKIVDQLIKSLSITNNNFHTMGVMSIGQKADQQALSVQTDEPTVK